MKNILILGTLVLGLFVSGVVSEAKDYAWIGAEYIARWIKGSIPVAVDIECLDLSIKKLDAEIANNGRAVVQESVALDRYEKKMRGELDQSTLANSASRKASTGT